MSTFKGIVLEFPQIRIDCFRSIPTQPAPLACFLSHVHSDHLIGLESLKAPFVYCSPATREVLLRLEKYPHRMNFAKGILETRVQTYRHLKNLLKTIPLETPTTVELSPGNEIRVTLFDANHCVGAVMFLIEGGGNAIIYTGDIRSEPWWVNSLVQNPVLVPYTLGPKQLDKIYLDTTFASNSDRYREFPSKAQGLKELLAKVGKYPKKTIFYVEAWTFGYENVWITLSSFLGSPIHLDRYRWGIYRSLANKSELPECREAAPLCGFQLGNHHKDGCLTPEHNVRIHSCERGTSCPVVDNHHDMIRIVPIVTRLEDGAEMHEMGIGGGKGDLDQIHELDVRDAATLGALMQLCAANISDKAELLRVYSLVNTAFHTDVQLRLDIDDEIEFDDMKLDELVGVLTRVANDETKMQGFSGPISTSASKKCSLPRTITFPYSRHSSYSELCALVGAFRPRDVYPCTVDEETWTPETSMRSLFGHLCSGGEFVHDKEMMWKYKERRPLSSRSAGCSRTSSCPGESTQESRVVDSLRDNQHRDTSSQLERGRHEELAGVEEFYTPLAVNDKSQIIFISSESSSNNANTTEAENSSSLPIPERAEPKDTVQSPSSKRRCLGFEDYSAPPRKERSIRKWAYGAATGLSEGCETWDGFGGLACARRGLWVEEEL